MALSRNYERHIDTINKILNPHGTSSIREAKKPYDDLGVDVYNIMKEIQPICFENVCWAYIAGVAIAIEKGDKSVYEVTKSLDGDLQSFCIPGSVADDRKVDIGYGNLVAMLLGDETRCFVFLIRHEDFAAAGGAIGITCNANKARKEPLCAILNGLGKDAAKIISYINGSTYVETRFDYSIGELEELSRTTCFQGERAAVSCYGVDDVREGVVVIYHKGVDASITGNSMNPTRLQHPVAGACKREYIEQGKKYLSVASNGGAEHTLHSDNTATGPVSYGMIDTMGHMYSNTQFVGSSSVLAHVEMMGLIGMGNNSMTGVSVAVAVAIPEVIDK